MERIPDQNKIEDGGEDIPNFHEISEDRKELRKAVSELGGKGAIFDKHYKKPLQDMDRQAGTLKQMLDEINKGKKPEERKSAKEFLKAQKTEYEAVAEKDGANIDYEQILKTTPELGEVQKVMENISDLKDFRMRRMFELLSPETSLSAKKRNEAVLKTLKEEIKIEEEKLAQADPLILRQTELIEYKEDLAKSGHICITPNVEKDLDAIGDRMLTGKSMFLHGPTGTGKTSLARFAAKHSTGKDPEMVFCNPQTKESNVWGKTGIKPAKGGAIETVEIYGPLAKAMIDGKTVIFDEFTALPKEQMVFIKGVFNAKVGDRINIVGNGIVEIAPGFQMIFTANLKSEKNPERQDLPPEIAREFEQNNLEVKYTKPDEAYDIMLSRLLNRDGSLDMSFYDLNTTLPNLCKVMSEIQESYTNETDKEVARRAGAMDASGKVYSLKKFVMTQGSIEAILSSWLIEKQTGKQERFFSEFLDERFKTALTFKEYPKEDRVLVAKILASKGFLLTLDPKELDLPEDIFKLNTIKAMRGEDAIEELQKASGAVKHLTLKEVAMLDPFGKRAEMLKGKAEALLGDENAEKGNDFSKNLKKKLKGKLRKNREALDLESIKTEFSSFLEQTYKIWSISDEKIKNAVISPKIIDPKTEDYQARQTDVDVSKFGEFTVNPDTQGLDWEALKDKIFIPDLSSLNGRPLSEVAKYLIDNFSDKYKIPGIEFWKYMLENPDKVPVDVKGVNLKDGNYYFNFGSLVRNSGGRWLVPFARCYGSGWNRNAFRLVSTWSQG
ncbi:MAG: AAA family ATPase, partial [Candidatus Taylorbacteria bacterium]|nr:AAA family ATPase [Candidatus Taylorbacteria bacterium]